MKDRILKLITHMGYTATKFADELGVQRSGISHILSGRNQPSYDFIVKTLEKFPDLDAEWLLLGKGTMFKHESPTIKTDTVLRGTTYRANPGEPDLFSKKTENDVKVVNKQTNIEKVTYVTSIQRIIVLNSDNTFDHYDPAKKE